MFLNIQINFIDNKMKNGAYQYNLHKLITLSWIMFIKSSCDSKFSPRYFNIAWVNFVRIFVRESLNLTSRFFYSHETAKLKTREINYE